MQYGFAGGMSTSWGLIALLIFVIPFWQICRKAGYSGWLSLLLLIPLVNVIFIYYLGFSQWPSLRDRPAQDSRGGEA